MSLQQKHSPERNRPQWVRVQYSWQIHRLSKIIAAPGDASVMAVMKATNQLFGVRFQCDYAFVVRTKGHIAVGD